MDPSMQPNTPDFCNFPIYYTIISEESMFLQISFTYTRNTSGPKTLPCGTPKEVKVTPGVPQGSIYICVCVCLCVYIYIYVYNI